jgi:hypothetical protein
VTPTRFIREIPEEFLDSESIKKHDERKEEYVADFFESMRKQFAEKGLTRSVAAPASTPATAITP